jgi:uncharacterized heparinase superfamily protein
LNPLLYFHTIRFLRPIQVFGRLRFRLFKPTPDLSPPPQLREPTSWISPAVRSQRQFGARRFRFLNVEREIRSASDWNNPQWDKLWLYNLHYFDDLTAKDAASRTRWHRSLMQSWITQNPPAEGNGWEPYPISIRVVNWMKWALAGTPLSSDAVHSLALQCRFLSRRLEFHLQGNHLWANAKALVFAGLFFQGYEAAGWLATGLRIVAQQLQEQVLNDGGHFERTPMYHNIVLEDLLDLLNVLQTYPGAIQKLEECSGRWRERAYSMLGWTRTATHPDGQIALVNDSAFDVAAPLTTLTAYAARLGINIEERSEDVVLLADTGYVRVRTGDAWALLDVGAIGPDYLLGHAHADTLSFELSLKDRRVIVDSGTSLYEASPERVRQRSTGAHNTVEIDDCSSSEVWGSFRVARRAYPFGLELLQSNDMILVRCAHDGYERLRGRPVHRREWVFNGPRMTVHDRIEGKYGRAVARFHFHPECALVGADERSGAFSVGATDMFTWRVEQGRCRIVDSTYHPQFGLSVRSKCLEVDLVAAGARTCFEWTT